ncbi:MULTISPECIES: response regulator transcription factor [Spirosoma]|uniref:Response regulator transcription factor n=1 Tax=Spirosoma sordidisoli TaxID=2502893 RepID=A0A4Q2UDC0_9BACT|nr:MULTISPECIES: response regulator transcription factor [Spirosoma]RYC67173.1 response regulator transcription factor [Spirosoma sordidisoli]
MPARTILIVEDDRRIAQNVSRSLREEGYLTEVAYEGYVGRQLAIENPIDLLLLDINLPGLNGYEVCRSVRAVKPELPIIMLTALGEIEDKVEGLDLGADDYVVKPFDLRELSARVGVWMRRTSQRHTSREEILQVADLVVNLSAKTVSRQNTQIDLTAREFMLLEYLLRNQGRVVSKMDLSEQVWGLNFDPGTNVVEVYINYLRRKIDRDFTPKLIHTRPGLGYVLRED